MTCCARAPESGLAILISIPFFIRVVELSHGHPSGGAGAQTGNLPRFASRYGAAAVPAPPEPRPEAGIPAPTQPARRSAQREGGEYDPLWPVIPWAFACVATAAGGLSRPSRTRGHRRLTCTRPATPTRTAELPGRPASSGPRGRGHASTIKARARRARRPATRPLPSGRADTAASGGSRVSGVDRPAIASPRIGRRVLTVTIPKVDAAGAQDRVRDLSGKHCHAQPFFSSDPSRGSDRRLVRPADAHRGRDLCRAAPTERELQAASRPGPPEWLPDLTKHRAARDCQRHNIIVDPDVRTHAHHDPSSATSFAEDDCIGNAASRASAPLVVSPTTC